MMILKTMSGNSETKTQHDCEFCKRVFARERTLLSHMCETKHRWVNKDHPGNRLGFHSWLQFYKKTSMSKTKNTTYEEFIRSPYYAAFAKFGSYCVDVNVINVPRYIDWLLKENIKLDNWNTDTTYTKFIVQYIRTEDAFDAIHRSVEHCIKLGTDENIQANDVLRYIHPNRICQSVITGKLSPWLLYQSDSGVQFLSSLSQDHVNIVLDYINPEQWALKFHRDPDLTKQIRDTLKQAGY